MTREQAIRILDPETSAEALAEIAYYAGFRGEAAVAKTVDDACILAVAALRAQEERRWIPVTERLPEKKGVFLVYVNSRNKWGGYIKTIEFAPCYEGNEDYMQGKQVWYDYDSECGDYEVRDVTHWMPMPEPPKGERL